MTWPIYPLVFFATIGIVDALLTRGPAWFRNAFDAWTDRLAGGPIGVAAPDSHVRKVER